ncbi:MAG TPA: hypothetical protein VH157_14605 [Bryobacteraceae bacterium]|jgi:uncharacterized protein (TIGR03437 family)|nr:hypothetical protein [Bryobacteraceae bacterium]
MKPIISKFAGLTGGAVLLLLAGNIQAQTPSVVAVVNAANSDRTAIAQGSFMSIYGQNLGSQAGPPSALPLPTTLGNTQVTIKSNSGAATYKAFLHFVSPGQINAILPSTVPVGSATIMVTVGTTNSAAVPFQVVQSSFGMFTLNSQSAGMAIAQNFESATSLPLNLYTNPARQGQTMILWGTGLGPYTAGSDGEPPQAGNIVGNIKVVLAERYEITPFYAGRAPGIPGVDQINFTLPDNIPDGCSLEVQVKIVDAIGQGSATIAKSSNAPVCQSPFALSSDQLSALQSGATLKAAAAVLQRSHGILGVANGQAFGTLSEQIVLQFRKFAANGSPFSVQFFPFALSQAAGTCSVANIDASVLDFNDLFGDNPIAQNLDTGSLTLSGPGTTKDLGAFGGTIKIYDGADIPGLSSAQSVLVDGDWTLSGAGGREVGSFSVPFTLQNQFKLQNVPATITRGQPLNVSWSGGGSSDSDTVRIVAWGLRFSGAVPVVICTAPAKAGSFTIPGNLTSQFAGDAGSGGLFAYSASQPIPFSAPLAAGGSLDSAVIYTGILDGFPTIRVQ